MVPSYFIERPNPVVFTEVGRINFLPFGMLLDTIVVNGFKGSVGIDGLSVVPWKDLIALDILVQMLVRLWLPCRSMASC